MTKAVYWHPVNGLFLCGTSSAVVTSLALCTATLFLVAPCFFHQISLCFVMNITVHEELLAYIDPLTEDEKSALE